jgi:hypothetical protein
MLPESSLAPDVPSDAFLARTRRAVYQLNLAARHGHVAAAQQLKALAGRRNVVSACCVGCGAVRKLAQEVLQVPRRALLMRHAWSASAAHAHVAGAQGELQDLVCRISGRRDRELRAVSAFASLARCGARTTVLKS